MAQESFAQWMYKVDKIITTTLGLSSDDLPDYNYRDAYEDCETPGRTARRAIRAAEGA